MPETVTIPHPRWRLPILGDILTVDVNKPCQKLAKDSTVLGGIFEQHIVDFPAVIVSDTALINEINDETRWEKHVGHSLRQLRPVAGDGLFTAYNDEPNWAKAHNILTPAFTKAAMTGYLNHPGFGAHQTRGDSLRTVDEAWSRQGDPDPIDPGRYDVDMGRVIGTAGENGVRIIVKPSTNEIVNAFPIRLS